MSRARNTARTTPQVMVAFGSQLGETVPGGRVPDSDLGLIVDVVYGEYGRFLQDERRRSHWVMDPGMWAFIRQAADERLSPWLRQILWFNDANQVRLLGRPIEMREGAWGIRLEAD